MTSLLFGHLFTFSYLFIYLKNKLETALTGCSASQLCANPNRDF